MNPYELKLAAIGLIYLLVYTFTVEAYFVAKEIRKDKDFDDTPISLLTGAFVLLLLINAILKAIPFVLFFISPVMAVFTAILIYGRIILQSNRGSEIRQKDLKLMTLSAVPFIVVCLLSILN